MVPPGSSPPGGTLEDVTPDAETVDPAFFAEAIESLPLAVVAVDRGGRAVYANGSARDLVKQSPDAGMMRLCETLVSDGGPVAAAFDLDRPTAGELKLPTDGGLIERLVWATPVSSSPAPVVLAAFHGADMEVALDDAQREVRARLEAMLEHTTEIITVLDDSGTVLFSNAAAGKLTGFAGSAVNGTSAFDLVHPEDRDVAALRFFEALGSPGVPTTAEIRLRYADGEYHDAEVHVNNLLEDEDVRGLVVTIHDVTERRRDELRLQQSEERHRSLVQNLTDVIVVLDRDFQITYVSPAIEKIIEAPADTNVGMSALNDIHPDDLPLVLDTLTAVAEGPLGTSRQVQARLETAPGSDRWRWIESVTVNRLDDPAVCGIVCTLRDITATKAAEEELQGAYERERNAAERLRELDRLKDEFLSTVSHELRTPLTSIVGFSRLLAAGDVDGAMASELLNRIAANASDMEVMVEQLLDFSSLEAGKTLIRLQPVQVSAAIGVAVDRLAPQLAAHSVDVDAPGTLVASADPDGLGHVLRNLLTNAAKYSEAGTRIVVRAVASGGEVIVSVRDEGSGIEAEVQQRIFERFYRAPDAAHAGRRGSGVGLNVVKRYAELMGGRVWLESEPGNGSTFFVALAQEGSTTQG